MPTQIRAKTRHLESSDSELVQQALAGDMRGFESCKKVTQRLVKY